jgi:biopolymer transport protein ExbB
MKEYAESALIAERRGLEKRLVILSTLGNNTPFIGLLGTVLGIMKAFRDLAEMGDSGPAVVMRGISEALIATAMGLGVAIPVVIAYNALSRVVQDKISQSEEICTLLRAIRLNK